MAAHTGKYAEAAHALDCLLLISPPVRHLVDCPSSPCCQIFGLLLHVEGGGTTQRQWQQESRRQEEELSGRTCSGVRHAHPHALQLQDPVLPSLSGCLRDSSCVPLVAPAANQAYAIVTSLFA